MEELLAERGVEVDHVTVYRWVRRFTQLLGEAARPCGHTLGGRWRVDETYVTVAGRWRYVYRAIDRFGQAIDVLVAPRRDATARAQVLRARGRCDQRQAKGDRDRPGTDLPLVLEDLLPAALHRTDRYANNDIETDHGRLKVRLRPMRGSSRTTGPGS